MGSKIILHSIHNIKYKPYNWKIKTRILVDFSTWFKIRKLTIKFLLLQQTSIFEEIYAKYYIIFYSIVTIKLSN